MMMFIAMLKKIKNGWLWFAEKIGLVNSAILLTIIYILVIGLYAIPTQIVELFRKEPEPKTLWLPFHHNQHSLEETIREF